MADSQTGTYALKVRAGYVADGLGCKIAYSKLVLPDDTMRRLV